MVHYPAMTLLGAIAAIWLGLYFGLRPSKEERSFRIKRKKGLWDGIL
jgi:hypothetical protein